MTTPSRGRAVLASLGHPADASLELRVDEPMRKHTTLRLGGPADVWAKVGSVDALRDLLARAHAATVSVTFVGGGSNLLVHDGGIRGLVVTLAGLNAVRRPDPQAAPGVVEVEAGATTGRLLRHATQWELGGVEFLGGVPGSVGGGLVMNAGTYLGEFTDVVTEVRSVRLDGTPVARDHDACGFRYRASDLPRDEVVTGATLRLRHRARDEIEADVAELRRRRAEREPHGVANSGSTFKNPPNDYAGRLIEAAGLKGTRVGGAVVSPVHANWLVVDRDAEPPCTSADLLALIDRVRDAVRETHGVELELEVRVVGEPGDRDAISAP